MPPQFNRSDDMESTPLHFGPTVSNSFAPPTTPPLPPPAPSSGTAPPSLPSLPSLPSPAATSLLTLPPVHAPEVQPDPGPTANLPLGAASDVPEWKRRRQRPIRIAARALIRLALFAATMWAAWFGWNWVVGDTFDADPATAPNAYEALDVRFTVRDPGSGELIEVHADLASRQALATSGDVSLARRDDGLFARTGSTDWRTLALGEEATLEPLLAAIDAAGIATIADVVTPDRWPAIDVIEHSSTAVASGTFIARRSFDPTTLGERPDSDERFPIPRLVVDAPAGQAPATAITVDAPVDSVGARFVGPLGLDPSNHIGGEIRLELVVDGVGVVHAIEIVDPDGRTRTPVYRLVDAAIDRPQPFVDTGLDLVERLVPPTGQVDLEMASREAIGPIRFQRIVDHTGVTMRWGDPNRRNFDAVATWVDNGSSITMGIVVAGFRQGGRDDLLAHELGHVAAFGIGIFDGSHECLADIVASHWLGRKVSMGAYDYQRCESHGDARRVLDAYE